jgi:predicted MFS family arabinose efflux permease
MQAPAPQDPGPRAAGTARVTAILATAAFASTFGGRALEPLVGVVARDLESEPATIALLTAAYSLPYALIQPILGPVGDALGKERVMTVCVGLLALALTASAFATGTGQLFALRIVSGATAGGVIPLVLAMIGDRVPIERRQVAISRLLFATITGQLSGSVLAGFLEGWIGWRGVLALNGAVAVVGFAGSAFGFAAAFRGPSRRFVLGEAVACYRTILGNPRARVLFGSVFVEATAIFGLFPYLAPLLEGRGEGGAMEAGLVLAGFALGGLAYALLVRVLLRFLGLRHMLTTGGLICAAALLVVGAAGSWRADVAAMLALGLGFYMLHNSFQTQVTEVAPASRGSAVALHAFSFFCGQAIGVTVFGLGLRTFGQFGALAVCAAAILALGLAAAYLLTAREGPSSGGG